VHDKPEEIHRCADFVETHLNSLGVDARRLEHNDSPSLLALPRDGAAPVLLMSHIDVVSAEPGQFEPIRRGNKLYGRGSLDDKYAVALSLMLIENHLKDLEYQGRGQKDLPLGLLITSDEEMGGFDGAGRILPTLDTEFVIVLDGGSPDKIVAKQKGFLKLRLVSNGQTAHGSQPWLGENAIELLMDDYHKLCAILADSSPDHWHRTVNLSILHSGRPGESESFNQVPDHAEAILDIRYTETDEVDALLDHLRHELQSEMHVEARGPVFDGGTSPYLDRLLDCVPASHLGFTHSASDARFLTEFGIHGIVWGAAGDESAHSAHEHVDLESANQLYGLLDKFFLALREVSPAESGGPYRWTAPQDQGYTS
jgi:succinyl-diaminopimelate desuccinylase